MYTEAFYAKLDDWFNRKFNCFFLPMSHEKLFGTALNTRRNNELSLNLIIVYCLPKTIYTTRKCILKVVIVENLS